MCVVRVCFLLHLLLLLPLFVLLIILRRTTTTTYYLTTIRLTVVCIIIGFSCVVVCGRSEPMIARCSFKISHQSLYNTFSQALYCLPPVQTNMAEIVAAAVAAADAAAAEAAAGEAAASPPALLVSTEVVKVAFRFNADVDPKRWSIIATEDFDQSKILPFVDRTIGHSEEVDTALSFYDDFEQAIIPTEYVPPVYINEQWWNDVLLKWTLTKATWEEFKSSNVRLVGISAGMCLGLFPPEVD